MTELSPLIRGQLRELEALRESKELNISCRIRASNDVEAMERWLDEYFEKECTFRTYKKEAERFLVWCAKARNISLKALRRDDIEAYINFLKDPQPRELWCGRRRGRKSGSSDSAWFPFAGPLSQSAIRTALAALNSMMSYLYLAGYTSSNPFALVRKKPTIKDSFASANLEIAERILEEREWSAVLAAMRQEPENTALEKLRKERLIFLVSILFFLGLRIDELARSSWDNFRQIAGKWWFFVRGKGDRLGKIPVNQELILALMKYRFAQGLSPLPKETEDLPIIASCAKLESGLSTRQISNLIKDLAFKAALAFPDETLVQKKLRRFSPHWLRHLSASRQDLAGISFTNIRQNMRHQNEQTTRLYVHAFDLERHQEMEKLSMEKGPAK